MYFDIRFSSPALPVSVAVFTHNYAVFEARAGKISLSKLVSHSRSSCLVRFLFYRDYPVVVLVVYD